MFFEKDMISLHIVDVMELKQGQVSRNVSARPFDALSFRISSDVWLKAGADAFHMQNDTLSFIPEGMQYSRTGTHDELIAVHFHMDEVLEKQVEIFQPRNAAVLRELFCRILACWKAHEAGYQYECTAILYEILAQCRRQMASAQADDRIQASVEYLEQNWNQPGLTIGELARQSFMSEVYFRKLFRARFGVSPLNYLMQLRIQKAADLIRTGYYTLKEVAAQCGYRDYKYFSVEFRRLKGCTPSEFASEFHE